MEASRMWSNIITFCFEFGFRYSSYIASLHVRVGFVNLILLPRMIS